MSARLWACLLSLSLMLLPVAAARGDAGFGLERRSADGYAVTGSGLDAIAALDFTIRYDAAILARPVVVRGAAVPPDASFFANTAIAGEIRIMAVRGREFSGSGTLATVTFERLGSVAPGILAFTANPVSIAAAPLDARTSTATQPASQPPQEQATPTPPAATRAETHQPGQPAGATVIAAAPPKPVQLPVLLATADPPGSGHEGETGNAAPAGETAGVDVVQDNGEARQEPPQSPAVAPQPPAAPEPGPDIRERFRGFTGTRSAAALLALFETGGHGVIREPAVAISDGASRVSLRIPVREGETPAFSLSGATMVDLRGDDGEWLLTVTPARGTSRAGVTMTDGAGRVVIPLTVAPPLDPQAVGLPLDETGLERFLGQEGGQLDLNGDGVRDYLDEYIFAANIMAARQRNH